MKKIGNKIIFVGAFCLALVSGVFAQNYKIKQTTTMNGQKMESTVYVKGSRKRTENGGIMGMGGGVADVEQCDLKRRVKISDKKKLYAIEPFDDGADTTPTKPVAQTKTPKAKVEKGGTVTYISNITDTGERKQMFGLTARRVKTSMEMQASPDACNKGNMKVESDGWYVDLPEFSCPISPRQEGPMMSPEQNGGGCRDKIIYKTSGGGKLGFPVSETRTFSMGDGGDMSFTQTVETLEFSKATLDAALFDIPTGYKETQNSSDLYGRPDFAEMMKNQGGNEDDDDEDAPKTPVKNSPMSMNNSASTSKKNGAIRIGVLIPTNKSGENISTMNLHDFLVQRLSSGKVVAIAVISEADARAADCDYVLTSDFSKLNQSTTSKIGGMFGKVTGGDPNALKKYDAQIDFKLVALTGGKNLSSKASNKSESSIDRAAEAVLMIEAQQILNALQ